MTATTDTALQARTVTVSYPDGWVETKTADDRGRDVWRLMAKVAVDRPEAVVSGVTFDLPLPDLPDLDVSPGMPVPTRAVVWSRAYGHRFRVDIVTVGDPVAGSRLVARCEREPADRNTVDAWDVV